MACGCGKKAAKPKTTLSGTTVASTSGQSRLAAAQSYQSGSLNQSPKGPVTTRKTV